MNVDWKFITEMAAIAAAIFKAGQYVSRIEVAAKRVEGIEKRLEEIPGLKQAVEFIHERLNRLEDRHDSTRAHAIRAEAHSDPGIR